MEKRQDGAERAANGTEEQRVTLTVRVPRSLARAFKVHTAAHDLTQQDVLLELIEHYMQAQKARQV